MAAQLAFWKQLVVTGLLVGAGALAWQQKDTILSDMGLVSQPVERSRDGGVGVPVIVAPVQLEQDDITLEAVGTGKAQRSVMLRPEASGKVVEILMTAGRPYRAGDVLLRLDDIDQRLAVQLSETRLQEAMRVRDRIAALQTSGNAAASRFDEAQTFADIAELELERAREALSKRVLRAPFDGVAGISSLDTGSWVDSDTEIASFDDRSAILVEFDLPEALLARVKQDSVVTATTPAVPDTRFEGRVVAIDTRIAAASRTVNVQIAFENREDLLRPGASFVVRLELPGDVYPAVPELAVLFSRGSLLVWRVVDGTVEPVSVRMVRRREGEILVDGPLSEGDAVVIEGTQRLTPGREVNVLKWSDGGAS